MSDDAGARHAKDRMRKPVCRNRQAGRQPRLSAGPALQELRMMANVIEIVDRHLAQEVSVGVTQEMVRTDSTNGKEGDLGRRLAKHLSSLNVGRVWCEDVFDGRVNTLWEVDSG